MNRLRKSSILLWLAVLLVPLFPQDEDGRENILGFLSGDYILIGKKIESRKTYMGKISFVYNEKTKVLDFVRTVNGKKTKGTAAIQPVLGGESQVLRLSFSENKVEYEGTFLWRGDLDNFGRLSGYWYVKGTYPNDPGLEAYFIDQSDN